VNWITSGKFHAAGPCLSGLQMQWAQRYPGPLQHRPRISLCSSGLQAKLDCLASPV